MRGLPQQQPDAAAAAGDLYADVSNSLDEYNATDIRAQNRPHHVSRISLTEGRRLVLVGLSRDAPQTLPIAQPLPATKYAVFCLSLSLSPSTVVDMFQHPVCQLSP